LVVSLGLLSCQRQSQDEISAEAPVVDSVASENGVTVFYETRGEGDRTLVLVHGWCCDRTYWQAQVDEFSKKHRVVAVDLAGHGRSGLQREVWTIEAFGADVAAVIEKLDLKDAILVGHSMGGPVIIETARRLPERVTALVGVDTYHDLATRHTGEEMREFLAPFRTDFKATTDQFVRSMFPVDADSSLVARVARDMSSAPADVATSAMEEMWKYDLVAALKEMRLPIRCINSDRYAMQLERNQSVAESFEVQFMPGVGHFVQMENPGEFNRLLYECLDEFWPKQTE